MKVIRAIGLYLWNVIKSTAAVPWTLVTGIMRRLFLLVYHIVSGPVLFTASLVQGFSLLFNQPKQVMDWLGKGLLGIFIWIGRIISKTLDIVVLGELLDLVFQIIKPNTRTLSDLEIAEAKKVFGDALTYWQIRVDEYSLIARLGAFFAGSSNMGVTTFHTINFTRKILTAAGNRDMEWLIHELAHVSQMENTGIQYIVEALVAQYTGGYNYGGTGALSGKKLQDFNREQQAEIAADYYAYVLYGHTPAGPFVHLIDEFRDTRRLFY
jgi:hypothetical protein